MFPNIASARQARKSAVAWARRAMRSTPYIVRSGYTGRYFKGPDLFVEGDAGGIESAGGGVNGGPGEDRSCAWVAS